MKKIVITLTFAIAAITGYAIDIPSQSSPSNEAVNQNVNVTLWINTVSGATHYDYMVDIVPSFDSPALVEYSHTSSYSGWTPNDLYFGETHYWRVRARNATETSDWSDTWSFTTRELGAVQSSPSNGSVDRGVSLTLSINRYGSRYYDYQLDTSPDFDSADLQEFTQESSYSGQNVSNLQYGQTYYWRVRGRNENDTSEWSEVWSFTTNPLGAWHSSPANGSTDRGVGLTLSINKLSGNTFIDY